MNARNVTTIIRKELWETLRDKRTLIAMIGIPLVLYPVLILVVGQAATVQAVKMERRISRVAVIGEATNELREWVRGVEKVEVVETTDARGDLESARLDAVVRAAEGFGGAVRAEGSGRVDIEYDSTEPASVAAMERVRDGLRKASNELLERRLAQAGLRRDFTEPVKVVDTNIAPIEKRTGFFLGTMLPMMMILMIGVGAFYPAIDLTAGEKERGTFETLLSTPVSKTEIVCGKFVTVLCLAIFTGLLNLGSMSATIGYQLSRIQAMGGDGQGIALGSVHLTAGTIALMVLVMVPLAFFICAVMMSVALLARNFKEANNYVGPFFLFITLPGVFAAMPGTELTRTTACVPIGNVVLLFRELLVERASAELAFMVLASTAAYATIALVAAVWLFQREDVILSEDKGIPLTPRRSQFTPRSVPTGGMAMMLFAIAMLLLFYIGSYVQQREIISGILITQWLLLLAPTVALLWYTRVNLRSGLNLRPYPLAALPATLLLAFGVYILTMVYQGWQETVLPTPREYSEQFNFIKIGSDRQALLLLLAIGVSPAICEEVLFRGAILSGLRTRLPNAAAILIVGLLFGLFHIFIYKVAATALLGMAITYIAVRSNSIYPGMLFHLLVNTTTVLLINNRLPRRVTERFEEWERSGFSWGVIAAAIAACVAGVAVMELAARRSAGARAVKANA